VAGVLAQDTISSLQLQSLTELTRLRIVPQIREIQAPSRAAPQTDRVDHLQQRRVKLRCQRALPAMGLDLLRPPVNLVKEGLHLVTGASGQARSMV
jgi:hypothetical protein